MQWAVAYAVKLLLEPLLAGRALREEICVDGRTEVLKLPQVTSLLKDHLSKAPQKNAPRHSSPRMLKSRVL